MDRIRPLENCRVDRVNAIETQYAWQEAAAFCQDACIRKTPPRWLSLLGPPETGKTMLARTVYRSVKAGRPGMQCSFFRWSSIVRQCFRQADWDMLDFLIEDVGLLVIDDVAPLPPLDGAAAMFCELVEGRLGKWTVWTSAFTLERVRQAIEPRLASRMRRGDSRVCRMGLAWSNPSAQAFS